MALSRRAAFKASAFPLAAGLAALPASGAMAAEGWCDIDPLQLVVTNGGALVPIFVTNGARSLLYAPQLLLARITHTVKSVDRGKATLVTVSVTVPSAPLGRRFEARTVVSSGPLGLLKVYGTATGTSGRAMTVQFKLPIA